MFLSDCSNPTLYHNFLKSHMIKSIVSSHGSAWVLFSFHIANLEFSENCEAIMWFGLFLKLSTICAWNISKFSPSQCSLIDLCWIEEDQVSCFNFFDIENIPKRKEKLVNFTPEKKNSKVFQSILWKKKKKFPPKKSLDKNVIYLLQR